VRIAPLVDALFQLYGWVIFARLILSWIRLDHDHPVITFLYRVTEPALRPARQMIPPAGGLDFSPIIVFIVLGVVRSIVVGFLRSIGL